MAKVYCSVLFSFAVYRNMYTDRRANKKQSVPVNGSPNLIARHCNQCLNCGRKNAQNKSVDSNRERVCRKRLNWTIYCKFKAENNVFSITAYNFFPVSFPHSYFYSYPIHDTQIIGQKKCIFFFKIPNSFSNFPTAACRYAKICKVKEKCEFYAF